MVQPSLTWWTFSLVLLFLPGPQASQAWTHCAFAGDECECAGLVRFGSVASDVWSEARDLFVPGEAWDSKTDTVGCGMVSPYGNYGPFPDIDYGSGIRQCQCKPRPVPPPNPLALTTEQRECCERIVSPDYFYFAGYMNTDGTCFGDQEGEQCRHLDIPFVHDGCVAACVACGPSDCFVDNGEECTGGNECGSNQCDAITGTCVTCSDDDQNGYETDVNCGGGARTCPRCANDKKCIVDDDCASGWCDTATNTCQATTAPTKVPTSSPSNAPSVSPSASPTTSPSTVCNDDLNELCAQRKPDGTFDHSGCALAYRKNCVAWTCGSGSSSSSVDGT